MSSQFVINGRFFGLKITGIERYATELTSRLPEDKFRVARPKRSLEGASGFAWDQLILPNLVRRDERLISLTHLGPVSVPNQILVLHDAAVFDHPELFSKKAVLAYKYVLPRLSSSLDILITSSEFSKKRIVDQIPIQENKVHVIHPGVSELFYDKGKPSKKEPYILCYGTSDPRKNIKRAAEAWLKISEDYPDYKLKIVGKESDFFAKNVLPRSKSIEQLGYVTDEELSILYRNASLFLYPSLYEGFGLPIAEALASSTPVVASDIPVFRELFSDDVKFVDPHSVESISHGIQSTLEGDINETSSRKIFETFNFSVTAQEFRKLTC
jgi:glycosyltransferase involved in cell wall biosynthesis